MEIETSKTVEDSKKPRSEIFEDSLLVIKCKNPESEATNDCHAENEAELTKKCECASNGQSNNIQNSVNLEELNKENLVSKEDDSVDLSEKEKEIEPENVVKANKDDNVVEIKEIKEIQRKVSLNKSESETKSSKPIIMIKKALCADYRSDSDSDSCDSESDSPVSDSSSSDDGDEEDSEDEDDSTKKTRTLKKKGLELSLEDLPPIENLKITVPEDECLEIGVISSIVDSLVVVESYKGTEPLDLDSILFLDKGHRTLGRIFDVLGPVSEPIYTVRFTNEEQIKENNISKGMKVFCAPRSEYAAFVFLSDLMKVKGSDASWKDNIEAPPECQDFSDDEEEKKFKNGPERTPGNLRRASSGNPGTNPGGKKMRGFNKDRPQGPLVQPSRFNNFQHPGPSYRPNLRSNPSTSSDVYVRFPAQPPPQFSGSHLYSFSYNIPPFPGNTFVTPPPPPPHQALPPGRMSFPPRSSGPPYTPFVTPPPGSRMPYPFSQGGVYPMGPFYLPRPRYHPGGAPRIRSRGHNQNTFPGGPSKN